MGFWSKLFGFDKRWAVVEQKLLDQAKHHHRYLAQLDTKLEIMAHDVVGHLHTVPNENKINLLEQQLADLQTSVIGLTTKLIELKSTGELLTGELEIVKDSVSVRHIDVENMKNRIMSVKDQANENKDNIEELERHHNHVRNLTKEDLGDI